SGLNGSSARGNRFPIGTLWLRLGDEMPDDRLQLRLERFLAVRLGCEARVTRLERSTEGFSQETFTFDVEVGGVRRGYVAKREPVAGLLEPYDLKPEFRVLHALSDDPLPSPPTPWFEGDPTVLLSIS